MAPQNLDIFGAPYYILKRRTVIATDQQNNAIVCASQLCLQSLSNSKWCSNVNRNLFQSILLMLLMNLACIYCWYWLLPWTCNAHTETFQWQLIYLWLWTPLLWHCWHYDLLKWWYWWWLIMSIALYAYWCCRLWLCWLLMHMIWSTDNFNYVLFALYNCIRFNFFFYAVSWIPLYVVSSRQTHRIFLG